MKKNFAIAAATVSVFASSTFGGFTVTVTRTSVGEGLVRWDYVAVNDGIGTGTQIKGLEYFYHGAPAFFEVNDTTGEDLGDPDGIPDTVNLLSASRTRLRVSTTAANSVYVGVSPSNGFAQPNPYVGGATVFSGAIANLGATQATGAGFQIARLFLPVGGTGAFSGNLGGDVGLKVPFFVILGDPGPEPPIIYPVPPVNVVFGQIVTSGAPFSVDVSVESGAADTVSLYVGSLPAAIRNVQITPHSGSLPQVFTVSGTVDYSANGTDVVIPLVAADPGSGLTGPGSITLHVTPEPWSTALFAVLSAVRRRRVVDGPGIAGMMR